jgi:iron complex outermembrane receptor protein
MSLKLRAAVSAHVLAIVAAAPAFAQSAPDASGPFTADDQTRDIVVVTGAEIAREDRPTTSEVKSAEEIALTTNVINAEDSLRYFPNIVVRKRHVGDTQAPITTRTSGVGASARSLIYADGVLLSALIGNNNSTASPKWGMVSPEEIAAIDVAYGPFSAAYAGNSIGAVVEIVTRMPEKLEGSVSLTGSLQRFDQYSTKDDYPARQASGIIGDRIGPFSFWLSATHTDSDSQPLAYITATRPASPSSAGTPLTGAFADFNRTGAPIAVLGAGGLEKQKQDNAKFKVQWDITPRDTLAWTIGRFANDTTSDVQSYLRNSAGAEVFSGGPFNIGGYSYTIAASAFSNNVYDFQEEQWMNALAYAHDGETFDWRITATSYDYDQSEQRLPTIALPAARAGGAGSITRFDGTRWQTLDAKAVWQAGGGHEVSFGAHGDRYELANKRYATTDWINGPAGALASASLGKTQTAALWAQDAWRLAPDWKLIYGGRWETWKAKDGFNYSSSPALNVRQPEIEQTKFSPKASLSWEFAPDWSARASVGQAYRFPTVAELYQAITTGATLTVPNPNLKPEKALSSEWSVGRRFEDGDVRVSFFTEDIEDALISQSAPLVAGSTTLFNFVQNVAKVESRGIEFVASKDNVLIRGLSLSGNVTYVDAKTAEDPVFRAAEGKQTPQVPKWRSTVVATYRPDDKWAFTLAGRYVDRVYGTIDNSDSVSHTFQGFEGFMTWDARVTYDFDAHWRGSLGVENFADNDYFLFHPFPQRTATAELNYRF